MDPSDRLLLTVMQDEFPLVRRPYAALAERANLTEEEALARTAALRREGIIRQVSAIFDTRKLGYRSSLVAVKVPPERALEAARAINQHPGVSHNYERSAEFNLWYTVAVPPGESLERDVETLAERARADRSLLLPTLKLYKIGVKLDMTKEGPITETGDTGYYDESRRAKTDGVLPLTEEDLRAIREAQRDLPTVAEPFAGAAGACGMDPEAFFGWCRKKQEEGRLRRFAAILRHRKAGFASNGMLVWEVPADRCDEMGAKFGSFKIVSHCYRRPVFPDWPYSLYTMVHGKNDDACLAIAKEMEKEAPGVPYRALFSTREFKKVRVKYFTDDYARWKEGKEMEVAAE